MRRNYVAVVGFTALAPLLALACGGEEPKPVPPPTTAVPPPPPPTVPTPPAPPVQKSMTDMQKEAIEDALKGLNGQDAKKFASVYADNALVSVAGLNDIYGRDGVEANMTEWFQTFKDVKLGFSRVWAKNEVVVLEWVINGKHHGELFGVKGTEQPIGHYGLSVVTVNKDGKVASEHRYGELGAVMAQVAGGAKAKDRPIPSIPPKPEMMISQGSPDEDKNVGIAKSVLASLEAGKKEADFTGLLADDVEQNGLFHLEMSKGKDGAKSFYKNFTTAFPDAKFETGTAVGVGDYAIVESILKGTQKGKLGSIPATKKPIAIHLVDIFQIKDGKVVKAWTYQNSLEMQAQLGLFNGAGAAAPSSQATPAKSGGGTGTGGGKDTGGGGGKGTGGGKK